MIDSNRDEIAKLESLFAMNPEGRVFTHLAEACRKAGQLERARQILEEGLQRHPDYASAHVVLGRVLADSGEEPAAIAEFRRVLELDRHNLVALRSLGELAVRRGEKGEAIHYYSELAVLDPGDSSIQEQLATLREGSAGGGFAPGGPDAGSGVSADASPVAEGSDGTERDRSGAAGEGSAFGAPAEGGSVTVPDESPRIEAGTEPRAEESTSLEAGQEPGGSAGTEPAAVEPAGLEIGYGMGLGEWGGSEVGESGAAASEAVEADGGQGESKMPEPAGVGQEAPEGLEPTSFEPPSGSEPEGGELPPEWPGEESAGSGDVIEQPGEHPPIDEAAWLEIAVGDAPSGEASEAPSGEEAVESGEVETEPEEEEEAEPSTGVEGRWQEPEPLPADGEAERSRTDSSAEWIPSDRWEWVAASADTSPAGSPEADVGEAEPGDDTPAPAEPGEEEVFDDETSFAGLMSDEPEETSPGEGVAATLGGFEGGPAAPEEGNGPDAELETEPEVAGSTAGFEEEVAPGPAAPEPEAASAPSGGDRDSGISWVTEADDEGDQVITETLAEIYASQGLYDRAAGVYRRLIESRPDDDRLVARLADLEAATGWSTTAEPESDAEDEADREAFLERVESAWTGGAGVAGMEESPYVWTEPESGEPQGGPPAGAYFASLLAWRPSEPVPSVEAPAAGEEEMELVEDWYAEEAQREGEGEVADVDREGEEDLEMFRSWLKSLKK